MKEKTLLKTALITSLIGLIALYLISSNLEINETSIEKFGPRCYNVNINNCEILRATERLMLESFIEINKLLKEN